MCRDNDKRIADWLQVSIATYYRWRKAGLLPLRPIAREEAAEMRRRIDAARDYATCARQLGQRGRTSLVLAAKILGDCQ